MTPIGRTLLWIVAWPLGGASSAPFTRTAVRDANQPQPPMRSTRNWLRLTPPYRLTRRTRCNAWPHPPLAPARESNA